MFNSGLLKFVDVMIIVWKLIVVSYFICTCVQRLTVINEKNPCFSKNQKL